MQTTINISTVANAKEQTQTMNYSVRSDRLTTRPLP